MLKHCDLDWFLNAFPDLGRVFCVNYLDVWKKRRILGASKT